MKTQNAGKVRWGLLGAGALLDRWMKGAMQAEDAEIAAVASRTLETAKRQADKWNIPEYMTYDELIARDDLDVLYIPVPHTSHKELAMKAMSAGRNVVVEKPAGINAEEWAEMTECARRNHVFLMEAVWTRCFPASRDILQLIADGAIGDVRMLQASFCFRNGDDYQGRLYNLNTAGGALLDVGVYPLHFAHMIFGRKPVSLTGTAAIGSDHLHLEVDEQNAMIAQYDNGALAVMTSAIRTEAPDTAYIFGTNGYMVIPHFWKPSEVQLICPSKEEQHILHAVPQNVPGTEDEGYQFEIRHVNDCLRNGLTESPLVPWHATAAVLEQCDELRSSWGLTYPGEEQN